MPTEVILLILEAVTVYLLVLGVHALRHRYGLAPFYALLGGITAIMSWVTDAGLTVDVGGITFVVGSTVFYTSLLLGVFVVYVFDGPRSTRIAISTVAGVSALTPLVAAVLHLHMDPTTAGAIAVPQPSLRINTASVATTLVDLVFLGITWEFLGKPSLKIRLWFRTWLTLLGVMCLDVLLFATGAFAGTRAYFSVMQGTLVSRFATSLFALPFLYTYLYWQSSTNGVSLQHRPVLAIFGQVAEMEVELSLAEQEIERRKRAEAALRESMSLLDAAGELANVGGWRVDIPSEEVHWTDQTHRIHGVPADYEPSLEKALAFFHEDDRPKLEAALQRAIEHGEPYDLQLRFVTARGERRWVRTLCRPVLEDAETVELVGAVHDITEHRAMVKQLHDQRRMATVGQMAAGIAHDFRNRVNAITLYAEMALDRHTLSTAMQETLGTILHESRGIAELVQKMLDFSARSMIELRRLDLDDLVEEAVDQLRPELPENVDVRVETGIEAHIVEVDSDRIHQALVNLASNAVDAMPEGGTLTVGLSRVHVAPDGPAPDLSNGNWVPDDLPAGDWVCLSVTDKGTGMKPEVRARLFEPFFTTKPVGEGTGLGLSQVYGIVRQHESIMDVETGLGEGTTVRIYLPAHAPVVREVQPRARRHDQRPTVLLVEPNDALRHAERDMLESLGYSALTAKDGLEAVALSQAPRWSTERPARVDVLVTVLALPEMNGQELLEQLARAEPDLKAIAISDAPVGEARAASLREAGFHEVVSKPLEADALQRLLDSVRDHA